MREIDFTKKDTVYKEAKAGLAKYMTEFPNLVKDTAGIQLETILTAEDEEVLFARGWTKPGRGRGSGGKRGGGGGKTGGKTISDGKTKIEKKVNPRGDDGEVLVCPSCGSFRHLLADCPDSYENLRKSKDYAAAVAADEVSEEEAYFTNDLKTGLRKMAREKDAEDVILYTNNKKTIAGLGSETQGSALLDCGCSKNVMGEVWWKSYKASLPPAELHKVKEYDSGGRKFRFGGGEVLTSIGLCKFLAMLAGKRVVFKSHVVRSCIPLLWSRPSMARAGTILDLPNDRANILGTWVNLNLTSVGHYALDILPRDLESVEDCLLALPEDDKAREDVLVKIHRQFGHPREEIMTSLLKKVHCMDEKTKKMVVTIYDRCITCKQFSTTPPRPVVSLPAACEFNEVLTMDLKEVKVRQYKYIFHLIDAFTRLTVSVFLKDKKAETIIHNFMKSWVASYGRPARVWSDVGGEFNNDTMRQLAEAIGTKVDTGAWYADWMNGLNERNHCVVDRCFAKVMKDNPCMDTTIALAWAVAAKNGFPMHGGYSSYQLVYGKNPNLPNIMYDKLPAMSGVTTSESVAAHINALHASRTAFTEVMCDQKIRKAQGAGGGAKVHIRGAGLLQEGWGQGRVAGSGHSAGQQGICTLPGPPGRCIEGRCLQTGCHRGGGGAARRPTADHTRPGR